MVDVNGIGGLSGPAGATPGRARNGLRLKSPVFEATDGVKISGTSQAIAAAAGESEIRKQQIEEVKARLEEGAYKLQATVLLVAARVAPYVG